MANVIEQLQKPTLVIAHNKTLAAQLYGEFKEMFPDNAVEYFVSYYGFSKEIIAIKDIKEIKRSHNPIASSANSLDRIYISTAKKNLYIALKNNAKFIAMVKERMNS